MLAAKRLLTSRCFLGTAGNQFLRQTRQAATTKGYWPEPITQQTLQQFLDDIDYFEQPKKFINIGLRLEQESQAEGANGSQTTGDEASTRSDELKGLDAINVDRLLDMLGQDIDPPELDLDDAQVSREQLKNLAIQHGIYRDLFGDYTPKRDEIRFTPEQAERMNKLVPHYWISDQPRARADRHLKTTDPLVYFEPIVRVSARFVHSSGQGEEGLHAHTAHHGNIIPACEALVKPSVALDCRNLPQSSGASNTMTNDSQFANWTPGHVTCENLHQATSSSYFSLLLLNLDYLHPNSANLHWMVTNMKHSPDGNKEMAYEEVCDYLPVHGIRGFGYSRYVFVVLQHEAKMDAGNTGLQPDSRKFDMRDLISRNKNINLTPIGLSWFQTTWDESSNQVFHNHLKMRAPVYEHVAEECKKRDMLDKAYPGKLPFNIFMDHYRDPKETNERVLLERLKTLDPFDYKDQYVPPKVPPTVFVDENIPSWMTAVMFKRKNRIGPFRGLRPASVTIPLNNNADLDHPLRPMESSKKSLPGYHNVYDGRHRTKSLKDMPYNKPANEHTPIFVQDDHESHLQKVEQMMKDLKKESVKKAK